MQLIPHVPASPRMVLWTGVRPFRSFRRLIALALLAGFSSTGNAGANDTASVNGRLQQPDAVPALITLKPLNGGGSRHSRRVPQTAYISSRSSNFFPRYQLAGVGTRLVIRNEDTLFHNTHIFDSEATLFNVATPQPFQTVEKILPREGIFSVRCDLHPWMQAWIAVTDSAWYTILWQQGNFRITGIPPGTYRLQIWQPSRKPAERIVVLSPGEIRQTSLEEILQAGKFLQKTADRPYQPINLRSGSAR